MSGTLNLAPDNHAGCGRVGLCLDGGEGGRERREASMLWRMRCEYDYRGTYARAGVHG